jgi:hypothetical protein
VRRVESKLPRVLTSAVVIALASTLGLGGCIGSRAAPARPVGRFELRQIDARSVPVVLVADTVQGRVIGVTLDGAAIEVGRRSSIFVRAVRMEQLKYWPCSALRAMRADQYGGRSGGMITGGAGASDTTCDALRVDYDTAEVKILTRADSLWMYVPRTQAGGPVDTVSGRLRGDTLRVRVASKWIGSTDRPEEWVFVRAASRPST